MTDILSKIEKGLIINSDFILDWNSTQEQIVNYLKSDIQKINSQYYTFNSSLFDNQFCCKVGIHFSEKGAITKVELYQEQAIDDINTTFEKHQKLLEEYFGKTSKRSLGIFAILKSNRGAKEYKWYFDSITLTHSLLDRFGLEERIEFLVK